jgi:hypothetical protein
MAYASYDVTSEWLMREWPVAGPVITILEGMSGVGKSELADDLVDIWAGDSIKVRGTPGNITVQDLLLDIADKFDRIGRKEMSEQPDLDLVAGLIQILQSGALVIIDDFDLLLDTGTGLPPGDCRELLTDVAQNGRKGRLLLVTNRTPASGSWLDGLGARTRYIDLPAEDEGVNILEGMLIDLSLQNEVPLDKRLDVAKWLGRNPRAMRAFVECLRVDSLESLLELDPDAWDLRNDVASPTLTRRLEERFLSRTLSRLAPNAFVLAQMLSVYRKPFQIHAIDSLAGVLTQPKAAKDELSARFLLQRSRNWYVLHPIVRHLAMQSLKDNERSTLTAYGFAANHYTRHFRAHSLRPNLAPLGEAFVESRFHLFHAGRESEFESLASLFRRELLGYYQAASKLPENPRTRDEMTAVLMTALNIDDLGYAELRVTLTKLLIRRNRPGDLILALKQVTLASRERVINEVWLIRLRLTWEIEGQSAARAVARQAMDANRQDGALYSIYIFHAQKLFDAGLISDALAVLNEGEAKVPEKSVFGIYSLASFILSKANRATEAVDTLLKGYERLGEDGWYAWRLLEEGLFVAYAANDIKAIARIQAAALTASNPAWSELSSVVKLEMAGKYREAANLAEKHLNDPPLVSRCVFNWLACREVQNASRVLAEHAMPDNASGHWLVGLVALCGGRRDVSNSEFSTCLGRELTAIEMADDNLWFTLWSQIPDRMGGHPAFYFPHLPASLTGLETDLTIASIAEPASVPWQEKFDLPLIIVPEADRLLAVVEEADAARTAVLSTPAQQSVMNFTIVNDASSALVDRRNETHMSGDTNINYGQAGAMGSGSKAESFVFAQRVGDMSHGDLVALGAELERLRAALRESATTPDEDVAVAEIALAGKAVKDGDRAAAETHLRKAGRWALNVATTIGAALAAAALKSALGL